MTHVEYAMEYRYHGTELWRRVGRYATKAEAEQRIAMLAKPGAKVDYRVVMRTFDETGWSVA